MLDFFFILGTVVLIIFFVSGIFRHTTGWYELEKYYLTHEKPGKMLLGVHTISLSSKIDSKGLFNGFYWMIRIGTTDSGLYLASIFPFFPSLRPISIPWTEITIQPRSDIGIVGTELNQPKVPSVRILVSRELGGLITGLYTDLGEKMEKNVN